MPEYLPRLFVTLSVVLIIIVCYYFLLRPLVFFYIIYKLPIEQQYWLLRSVNNIKFDGVDEATKIVVSDFLELHPFKAIIEDPDKVEFAKQFIQRYPNGWVNERKFNGPTYVIRVEFYDDNDRPLNEYGIGDDKALVYSTSLFGNWRLVEKEELRLLVDILGIPEELLHRDRNWYINALKQKRQLNNNSIET